MGKGYIYAITSAILFGTAGMFVKLAQSTGLDSISLITVQYMLAVSMMIILGFATNKDNMKVSKEKLINLAVLGVVGNTFMTVFYYKAFEYLPVGMVTMLLFTYPIMVFIYSVLFENKKVDIKKAVAIFIAFIGCILTLNILTGNFNYSLIGIAFGLLSAVFYAFINIYCEKKLEDVDSLAINAYSTLFSLIVLMIYKFPFFIFKGEMKFQSIVYIILLAVVCEIIPLTLLYSAIKYIGSLKVSIIGNIEIPTALIVSFIILKEPISVTQILGAALIIYSIYLIKN